MAKRNEIRTKITPIAFNQGHNPVSVMGIDCFGVQCDNYHIQRYAGYKHIEMDITHCLHLLDTIDQNPNSLALALTTALATIYGKIFAQAEGRGVRLHKSDIPIGLQTTHLKVMEFRNSYAAHGGGTHEFAFTFVALNPNYNKKKVLAVFPPQIIKHNNINPEVRASMREILRALLALVAVRVSEIMKLIEESVKSIPLSELYESFSHTPEVGDFEIIITPGNYVSEFHIEPDTTYSIRLLKKTDR
jgi:hypothetical protein